ncbi:MAG: pilus assembly PilX N-terminal domain-containing protein [Gaiellaceae bacterium]
MKKLKKVLRREEGIAMATVVMMIAMLTLLGIVLIDQVTAESNRAAASDTSDAVYQAAEAGINDYIAKLLDDPQYYDHCVAKGESTRQRSDNSALVSASIDTASCQPGGPSAWTAGVRWSYPSGKNWWFAGTGTASGNSTVLRGYAYNLMITPPASSLGTNYITIVSTGCKVIDPDATPVQCDSKVRKRAVETRVRRTTPADFQFMMTDMHNSNVCWASNIYGRMYSAGEIKTCGAHAYGNLMAETNVTGSYYLMGNARVYDLTHPNIRDVVKNPIPFSSFAVSVSDIQRAAALNSPPTDFEDTSASSWRIVFSSNATVQVWKCTNSTSTPESTRPYCNDVRLSAAVTLKSSPSTTTVHVNESVASFPDASSTNPQTIYIGTGSTIDTVKYTSKGSDGTSFTGATCSACGSGSGRTHAANEIVSKVSGGLPSPVPAYNGPIPPNGAIYTAQSAIISWPSTIYGFSDGSSTVNGRLSVASGNDVIIGGNISYASQTSGNPDDDVLGLIAQRNVWLAGWAPDQLWFRASTMALTGLWGDYRCTNGGGDRVNSSMTFVGTSAYSSNSGCIQSNNGGYDIDHTYRITDDGSATSCPSTAPACQSYDALKFLFPPWFPVINGMETTVLFREMPSSYQPPTVTS